MIANKWAIDVIDEIPMNWERIPFLANIKFIWKKRIRWKCGRCPDTIILLHIYGLFFPSFSVSTRNRCRPTFPLTHHLPHHHSYNIVFLIVTYGVPMLVMVVCYTIMGKVLWGSQSIGEHTQRQIESIKAKKKVWDLPYIWIHLEFQNVTYLSRKHTLTNIHRRITSLLIFFCFLLCFFGLFIY